MWDATEPPRQAISAAEHPLPAHNRLIRDDRIAIAVLVVIATLFFGDVLAGVNQLYMRDLTRYYYPTKQILREIVRGGEFPYWNRHFSAGQPIAANPEHEVFYPLTWLILLPSYDLGYRLHILVHLYIGLLGMYALLRSMELRPLAAAYGALTFGLGGLMLSYVNLLPLLFCTAWLPLTCLFTRRFLLTRRSRDFALAGLFLGIQFLVAEPTTIMQTGFILGCYALYRGWYSAPRLSKSITRVLWIAAISIAGLMVGAVQVVPALDHVRECARSRVFDFDLVSAWSMPWAKFAELIYPNILGHISIDRVMWYWGGALYPGMGSPFLFNIYLGILTIAFIVAGAFTRPRGGRFVAILVAVSAALALGRNTPFLRALYDAGIATSIRYPEKFALIGIFAVIIFAAQMFDRMLEGDERIREGALGFTLATTVVAASIAGVAFAPLYGRLFARLWGLSPGAATNMMIELSRQGWWIAAARGLVAALLLSAAKERRSHKWTAAFIACVAADLFLSGHQLNPRMPRHFFDPPPAAATLPADRAPYRLFHEADWYGQEEEARRFFSTGDAVYWIVRNGLFPMTPAGSGIATVIERDYDKTALLPTIDFADSVWDVKRGGRSDWATPFMAMSNAWFRAVYRDFAEEQKRVHGDLKKMVAVRLIETEHFPRYYFADQIVTIRNRSDFVAQLIRNNFSPQVAFIQQPAFVPSRGLVRSVHETANDAVLEVESQGHAFLVMSVTANKYWRISMDNTRVPAVVTNIGYQGITVTPGRHTVRMEYRNDLIPMSGLVSALTVLMLAVTAGLALRGKRSHRLPAYQETLHVISDASGVHLTPEPEEAVVIERPEEDSQE